MIVILSIISTYYSWLNIPPPRDHSILATVAAAELRISCVDAAAAVVAAGVFNIYRCYNLKYSTTMQ